MRLTVLDSRLARVRSGTAGHGAMNVLPARLSQVASASCTTPDLISSVCWVLHIPTRLKRTGSFSGSINPSAVGAVVSDAAARVALMGANDVQSDIGVTDWLVFHG